LDGSLVQRVIKSDVHLDDDVMISMRVGSIINETGIPAFNRTDLAQPSTSYLAPYLFALLEGLMPNNIAVAVYALISFLGVSFLLLLVVLKSKSRVIGTVAIILIVLTNTFKSYSFMGWDHNLQSSFICLAFWLVLKESITWQNAILIGISLFLSVGFRPDSGVLAICVLLSLFLRSREFKLSILATGFFVIPLSSLLCLNWRAFKHFTPTTSRLKLGESLSVSDSYDYLHKEMLSYSTLNVILLAFLIYVVFNRFFPIYLLPIVAGCLFTAIYSLAVTDVFFGVRMSWTPALVMTLLITRFMPSPIKFRLMNWEIKSIYTTVSHWRFIPITLFTVMLLVAPLARDVYYLVGKKDSIRREVNATAISEQYALAKVISRNFNPSDGAVGLYLLGIGYHMPRFEIADFLGKADELIAGQRVKWGPPGHNKWDSEATINKWHPQIIIPAENDMDATSLDEAKKWLEGRGDEAYVADLRLSETVNLDYSYCKLRETAALESKVSWHFYLRNDLVSKYSRIVKCA
jgi:hypothetical protein